MYVGKILLGSQTCERSESARPCKRLEGRFPLYTLKSFLPLSLKNTRSDTIEVRVRIVE